MVTNGWLCALVLLCFLSMATCSGHCAQWIPATRVLEIQCPFKAGSKEDARFRNLWEQANRPEDWSKLYKELGAKLGPAPNTNFIELNFFGLSSDQVRKLPEKYRYDNRDTASISEDAKYFYLSGDKHSGSGWHLQYTGGVVSKIKPSGHACGMSHFEPWLTRDQFLWRKVFECDKALTAASAAKSLRKDAARYVRGFLCKNDNSDYNSILLERAALLHLLEQDDLALNDLMALVDSLQEPNLLEMNPYEADENQPLSPPNP